MSGSVSTISEGDNCVDIGTIQRVALEPYQKHRQLTIRESENIMLELITLLCDAYIKDEATLKYLGKLITPEMYGDLIDERNLNGKCGYPLCRLPPERQRDPFGMNSATKKFQSENNPYAYLSNYCNKFHFRCSQFYEIQLSDEALFARVGIHLIRDSVENNNNDNTKYNITLFEELLREKANEDDIKSVISGLKKLGLTNEQAESDENDAILEEELSKWLQDIKIVENDKPSLIGDFGDYQEN